MALFDRLRDLLGGSEPATDPETFLYRCRECANEFESARRHVTAVSCPACGADDVRVGDHPYLVEE